MTDIAAPIDNPIAPDASTTAGGAAPALASIPDEKGQTLRESIQAAMKDSEPKAEPQSEEKPKVEKVEESKPAVEEDDSGEEAGQGESQGKQSESRPKVEPPAQFKEQKARDLWYRAPNEVKAEVSRILKEAEETTAPLREVSERYEKIRAFDEGVRSSGGDLSTTLTQINDVGKALKSNPIMGLQQTLNMFGPRHPDGRPLSLQEVAHAVVQMGQDGYNQALQQGHQQTAQQQQQQQFQQMQAEKQRLEAELVAAKANPIIEPVRSQNPRLYDMLEPRLAEILQDGSIPQSLSPQDRLSQAFAMALQEIGLDPHPAREKPVSASEGEDRPSGGKSIKSSPGSVAVNDSDSEAEKGESIRDSLRKALRTTSR